MKKIVSIDEAKVNFFKLVREVEAGAEIIIARSGKPILKLVSHEECRQSRKLGFAKDEMSVPSDSAWEALEAEFNALFVKAEKNRNFRPNPSGS